MERLSPWWGLLRLPFFLGLPPAPPGFGVLSEILTGAVESGLYEEALSFADRHGILIASDIAYSELPLDDDVVTRSIFQIDPEKKRSIEFQSFSMTYCFFNEMTSASLMPIWASNITCCTTRFRSISRS